MPKLDNTASMKPTDAARNNNRVDDINAEGGSYTRKVRPELQNYVCNNVIVGTKNTELKSKNVRKSILVISKKANNKTDNATSNSASVVNSCSPVAGTIGDINYNTNYNIIDTVTTENEYKNCSRSCDIKNSHRVYELSNVSECNSNSESVSEELGNTRSGTESIGETTSESSELSLSLNSGVGTVIYGSVSSRDVNSFQEEEASKDKARKACAIT